MVERRIAFLETESAEHTADVPADTRTGQTASGPAVEVAATGGGQADQAPEPARMMGDASALPWITLAGGGLIAVGGATLVVLARVDSDAVEGAPSGTPWLAVADAADRIPVLYASGGIALAVGSAVAVGALVWAYSIETPADARVVAGPGHLGLEVDF
jgi:hypothetical protein